MAAVEPVLRFLTVDDGLRELAFESSATITVPWRQRLTLRPTWDFFRPADYQVQFITTAGGFWCGAVTPLEARGDLVVFEAPAQFPSLADIRVLFRSVDGLTQIDTGLVLRVLANFTVPLYRAPTAEDLEVGPRGSGESIQGREIFAAEGDRLDLVVTIANDDQRRGNTVWNITGGSIIFEGWDFLSWRLPTEAGRHQVRFIHDCDASRILQATVRVGPVLGPGLPPRCTGVELDRRGSGEFTSSQITTLDQGGSVDLVATIENDDGRRDNIIWTVSSGRIASQEWDQMTWEPPEGDHDAVVELSIDGVPQNACTSIFLFRGVSALPGADLILEDILSAELWQELLGNQAAINEDTGFRLPSLLGNLQDQVTGGVSFLGRQIEDVAGTTADLSVGATSQLLGVLEGTLGATMQQIGERTTSDILGALGGISFPGVLDIWDGFWSGIEEFLAPVIRTGANLFLEALETAFAALGGPLWARMLEVPDLPPWVRDWFVELADPTSQIAGIVGQAAGGSAVSGSITGIIAPYLRVIEHWANMNLPNVVPAPEFLTRLVQRGTLDIDTAESSFMAQGLSAEVQAWHLELGTVRPDLSMLLGFLRRADMAELVAGAGALGQSLAAPYSVGLPRLDVLTRIVQLGWETDTLSELLDQRLILPGIQDLIRFAVREAFTPQIVEEFQLDADFPDAILPFSAGQGLPPEWTRMFWRAHWELPAVNQGFQMRHRASFAPFFAGESATGDIDGQAVYQVIDDGGLDLLLRTQDVMVFWRERLKAISFNVLSRVDIRRMYDLGVVDAAEVELTYLSQGYNTTDAAGLREFVERLAIQPALTARISEVRQQFRAGIMDIGRAEELLAGVGPSGKQLIPLAAEVAEELATLELDRAGDRTARLLIAWQAALRKDLVDVVGFRAALEALPVPIEEIDFRVALDTIVRKTEEPTAEEQELRAAGRGTVQRRFREGLILEGQFRQEMDLLGYTAPETARYLDLATLEFDTNLSLDLLAAYRAGLRANRLTEAEFRALVGTLGIDPLLVGAYVNFDRLRRRIEPPEPEEQELRAVGRGTVLGRFREGWVSRQQFSQEMGTLGYTEAETDRYALVADYSFDFDWRQDALATLRRAFGTGTIDGDEFINRLVSLGMDPGRAQTHLALQQLRLLAPAEVTTVLEGEVVELEPTIVPAPDITLPG